MTETRMPIYQWRVYLTHQTSDRQSPKGLHSWVDVFKSEEAATRFATGGLVGPIKDVLGVEHLWSLRYLVKIEVEPIQQEPSGRD